MDEQRLNEQRLNEQRLNELTLSTARWIMIGRIEEARRDLANVKIRFLHIIPQLVRLTLYYASGKLLKHVIKSSPKECNQCEEICISIVRDIIKLCNQMERISEGSDRSN